MSVSVADFHEVELSGEQIGQLLEQGELELDALVTKYLWDGRSFMRRNAAQAIRMAEKVEAQNLDWLLVAGKDGDAVVRMHTAGALGRVDLPVELVVPALFRALADPDEDVASTAQESLRELTKRRGAEAIPHLIEGMATARPIARDVVTQLLINFEEASAPHLVEALTHGTKPVADAAYDVLRRLGTRAAAVLVKALEDVAQRPFAANLLVELPELPDERRAELEALAGSEDEALAHLAEWILSQSKAPGEEVEMPPIEVPIPDFFERLLTPEEIDAAVRYTLGVAELPPPRPAPQAAPEPAPAPAPPPAEAPPAAGEGEGEPPAEGEVAPEGEGEAPPEAEGEAPPPEGEAPAEAAVAEAPEPAPPLPEPSPDIEPRIDPLVFVQVLRDGRGFVRANAAAILGPVGARIDSGLQPVIATALAPLAKDPEVDARKAAVTSLGELRRLEAVGALVAATADRIAEVARAATTGLGKLGPAASPSILGAMSTSMPPASQAAIQQALVTIGKGGLQTLIQTLSESPNALARRASAAVLGQLQTTSKEVLEALVSGLSDEFEGVRAAAANSLGELGADDEAVLAALKKAQKDGVPAVRREAFIARARIKGEPIPGEESKEPPLDVPIDHFMERLLTPDELAQAAGAAVDVPLLVRALRDGRGHVRANAAALLKAKAQGAPTDQIDSALSALGGVVKDPEAEVRLAAVDTLGAMGRPEAAEKLALAAADGDVRVRQAAFLGLVSLGPEVGGPLMKALDNLPEKSQEAVADVLLEIGEGVVPTIAERLRESPSATVRTVAARVLGKLGSGARKALPELIKALKDELEGVRQAAAWALGFVARTDDLDVYEALFTARQDSIPAVSREAWLASLRIAGEPLPGEELPESEGVPGFSDEELDPKAAKDMAQQGLLGATDLVMKHLWDGRKYIRRNAAHLLRMSGEIKPVRDDLPIIATKDDDAIVREHMVVALSQMDIAATKVLPVILAAFDDPADNVREEARPALDRVVGRDQKGVAPILVQALADPRPNVVDPVKRLLIQIGPEAVPHLVHGLGAVDKRLKDNAFDTLSRMELADRMPLIEVLPDWDRRKPATTLLLFQTSLTPAEQAALGAMLESSDKELAKAAKWILDEVAKGGKGRPGPTPLEVSVDGFLERRLSDAELAAAKGQIDTPVLLQALRDGRAHVRANGASMLGLLGQSSPLVINGLAAVAKDPDDDARLAAVKALGALADPEAARPLAVAAGDDEQEVAQAAFEGLAALPGTAVPAVLDALGANLSEQSLGAVHNALVAMAEKAVPELANALLGRPNAHVRVRAASVLADLGEKARDALPALLETVANDSFDPARASAARALGYVGQAEDRLLEALKEAMGDGAAEVRREAWVARARLKGEPIPGEEAEVLPLEVPIDGFLDRRLSSDELKAGVGADVDVATLRSALGDGRDHVRANAAELLGLKAGALPAGEKPAVAESLSPVVKDPQKDVRAAAVAGLAALNTVEAIPALVTAAGDVEADIAKAAFAALVALGPNAVPALLESISPRLSGGSLEAVRQALLSHGKAAVPALADAMVSASGTLTRGVAAGVLGDLGADAEGALSSLCKALEDEFDGVRQAAARAIGLVGKPTPEAMEALNKSRTDKKLSVRRESSAALARLKGEPIPGATLEIEPLEVPVKGFMEGPLSAKDIDAAGKSDVPVELLLSALRDGRAFVRANAAAVVGLRGKDLSDDQLAPVVAALGAVVKDPETAVRSAAVQGLAALASPEAVPALLTAAGDDDDAVAGGAYAALVQLGDAAAGPLLEALSQARLSGKSLEALRRALVEIGQPAVPALYEALKSSPSTLARGVAADVLGEIGEAAAPALAGLIAALNDEFDGVRQAAVRAIGFVGKADDERVAEAVRKAQQDRVPAVSREAWFASLRLAGEPLPGAELPEGEPIPEFHQQLIDEAKAKELLDGGVLNVADLVLKEVWDGREFVRENAALALRAAGEVKPPRDDLPLIAAKDSVPEVRRHMLAALASLDIPAVMVLPVLLAALDDPDAGAQSTAWDSLYALVERDTKDIAPQLVAALGDDRAKVVDACKHLLVKVGGAAVPVLVAALGDVNLSRRDGCFWALTRLGPDTLDFDLLVEALGDPDRRKPAAKLLSQRSKLSAGERRKLETLVASDEQPQQAKAAKLVIQQIDAGAEPPPTPLEVPVDAFLDRQLTDAELDGAAKAGLDTGTLVRALKDGRWFARANAAGVLERLGKSDPEVVEGLSTLAKDPAKEVRLAAVKALGKIGDAGGAAAVAKAVVDPDPAVEQAARDALPGLGGVAVPELLSLLDKPQPEAVVRAVHDALVAGGGAGIKALTEALAGAANTKVRGMAATVLGDLGKDGAPAIPALIEALGDDYEGVRALAARALGLISANESRSNVVTALEKASADLFPQVSREAWLARLRVTGQPLPGEELPEAEPIPGFSEKELDEAELKGLLDDGTLTITDLVLKHLWDGRDYVRRNAAHALKLAGTVKPDRNDLPIIATKDSDWVVRDFMVTALSELEIPAVEVLPVILAAIDDPAEPVQQTAFDALDRLVERDTEGLAPLLVKALEDNRARVHDAIKRLLFKVGEPAVEPLVEALGDFDSNRRDGAFDVLARLEIDSLTPLIEALDDSYRRKLATQLLQRRTEVKKGERKALEARVESEDPEVAKSAKWILAQIDEGPKEAPAPLDLPIPDFTERRLTLDELKAALEGAPAPKKKKKAEEGEEEEGEEAGEAAAPAGPASIEASAVVRALRDGRAFVRANGADLLGLLAKKQGVEEMVASSLATLVRDPAPNVRFAAVSALAGLGQAAAQPLVIAAGDISPDVSDVARDALCTLDAQAAPVLLSTLAEGPSEKSLRAVEAALVSMGKPAVSPLVEVLSDSPNALARAASAYVLGQLGGDAAGATDALVAALKDTFDGVRMVAARAVGSVGETLKKASDKAALLEALEKTSRDRVPAVSREAWLASLRIKGEPLPGAEVPEAEPIPEFSDREVDESKLASLLKDGTLEVSDLITKYLWDGRDHVRRNAALALTLAGEIKPDRADLPLIASKDADWVVRQHVVAALSQLKLDAAAVLPVLLSAIDDPAETVRMTAWNSLFRLVDREGDQLAEGLVVALSDRRPVVNDAIRQLLFRIGEPSVPHLVDALGHADRNRREASYQVLSKLGLKSLAPLIEAIVDRDRRPLAVKLLEQQAEVDDADRKAIEALIGHDDPDVKKAARWVLAQLDAPKEPEPMPLEVPIPHFMERRLTDKEVAAALSAGEGEEEEEEGEAPTGVGSAALLRALRDGRWFVKANGAALLAPRAKGDDELRPKAVAALATLARDPSPEVRRTAVVGLGDIGAAEGVSAMVRAAGDRDPLVREAARNALAGLDPGVAVALLESVRADLPDGCLEAVVDSLVGFGKKVIKDLQGVLAESPHPGARELAATALGRMGADAKKAKKALIDALTDHIERVSRAATRALGLIGDDSTAVMEALDLAFHSAYPRVRREAWIAKARILGEPLPGDELPEPEPIDVEGFEERPLTSSELGDVKDKVSVERLAQALKDGRAVVRLNAAAGLEAHGARAAGPVAGDLALAVKDADRDVRAAVVSALVRMGKSNIDSTGGALVTALGDPDPEIAQAARDGVAKLDDAPLPALLEALDRDPTWAKKTVVPALAALGKTALDALVESLDNISARVRANAVTAIGAMDRKTAAKAREAVEAACGDEADLVKAAAREALDAIDGVEPPPKVLDEDPLPMEEFEAALLSASDLKKAAKSFDLERLQKALFDGRATVRTNAARALGQVGKKAAEYVDYLVLALKDSDLDVRTAAAESLGLLAVSAETAVPALAAAAQKAPEELMEVLVEAVNAFGKDAADPLMSCLNGPAPVVHRTVGAIVRKRPDAFVKPLADTATQSETVGVRENAVEILDSLGSRAVEAEKALVQALDDKETIVCLKAIRALANVAKPTKKLIDALEDRRKAADYYLIEETLQNTIGRLRRRAVME